MLRTIFVISLLLIFARYSFKAPFYTLLFYLFLAYFRPEYWVWSDFLFSANVSYFVGLWVIGYAIVARPNLAIGAWPWLLVVVGLHALVSAWASVTSFAAMLFWQDFAKTLMIGLLCVILIDDEAKLRKTLLVIAFSLGFEGAKQGWTTLLINPGGRNANGWPNLGDNNGVGIGMAMLVSLFLALANTSKSKWEPYVERFFLIGVMYRAVSTYSRGTFLALGALVIYLIMRGKRKVRGVITFALALGLILPALPNEFWERMGTIRSSATAESEDQVEESAAGRLHFWQVAVVMANANPWLGVGPYQFNNNYDRYDFSNFKFGHGRSVHSAWLGVLAELGYVGLGLVLLLMLNTVWVAYRARRLARRQPEFSNLASYATGIEGALLVAVVGGTFYPFQYMEPLWHMLVLGMVVGRLIRDRLAETAGEVASLGPPVVAVRTSVQLPKMTARSRVFEPSGPHTR